MARADPLAKYNAKRDFTKTAEPRGTAAKSGSFIFMVQKHDATRLHYDLRLELDGVLKSWAVTRGPSPDPDDKRLAVRTEDHPLDYATFEGTIPKGEYGGGTVMLWDWGRWIPVPGKDPRKTLEEGHLHFTLEGQRMKGDWIMFRLKPRGKERTENWILRKIEDDFTGSPTGLTDKYLTSIKTGRTMQEIAAGKKAKELATFRKVAKATSLPSSSPPRTRGSSYSSSAAGKKEKLDSRVRGNDEKGGRIPRFREVQKATLVDSVPSGSAWIHEMKYDGYRCMLAVGGGKARIYTRSGLDWSDKFPEIREAATQIDAGSALIDGEIVKLDEKGNTSFSALQQGISEGGKGLSLFVFDLLELDGKDIGRLPNVERKQKLADLIGDGDPPLILYAHHIVGQGEKLFEAMCKAGQEGIISKRADAAYTGGRTKSWLKIKCVRRQEFIIAGWSPSDSKARALRSLFLAVNERGKLRYAGKVGTGFSMATMEDLLAKLGKREIKKAPVEVPRADARGAHWVKPDLVAEIAFAEFTSEGVVRHASFLGLRGDKKAREIVVEKPQPLKQAVAEAAAPTIKISNRDRIVYPEAKITKGQLADYFVGVGSVMLPWVAKRPLTLVRCPQGWTKECFFQKHDAGTFGPHVHHIPIKESNGKSEDYLYVDDLDGILACVQMGSIEFHGWGSRTENVEAPDRLVFDLDPDVGLGFAEVKRAARDVRRHLADMGLQTWPMLTGGKGLHVIVPLTPQAEWPQVKDFAQRFCVALATAEPDRFTANLAKARRKGRIFLDYLRNQRGATAILPYSSRARAKAPVAAPIHWEELDEYESGSRFTVKDIDLLLERAAGRALRDWGEAAQELPDI
jgi:bifunctional non-homologous end joining protein LigD